MGLDIDTRKNLLYNREFEVYRTILDQTGEGISIVDDDGKYVGVNAAFSEMSGFTEAELLEMEIKDLVPEGITIEVFPSLRQGKPAEREVELLRKDGSTFSVALRGFPLRFEGIQYYIGVIKDISQLKKLRSEMQRKQEIFDLITEYSYDFIWTLDMDFNITYASKSIERLAGYTPQELLLKPIQMLYSEAEFDRIRMIVAEELAKGASHSDTVITAQHLRKDGTQFTAEIRGKIVYDKDGRPTLIQGYTRDISDRVLAEEKLRKSEAKYRSLFLSSPDPIVIHDGNEILDLNPACVKALGVNSREDILGRDPMDLVHPDDREEAVDRMLALTQGVEGLNTMELKIALPGGGVKVALATPGVFEIEDRRVLAVHYHDITARKQAEHDLQRSAQEQATLLRISQQISSTLDLENILQTISDGVSQLLSVDTMAIYLKRHDRIYLGAATPALAPDMPDELRWADVADHPILRRAIETQEPIQIEDSRKTDLSPAERMVMDMRNLISLMYFPFVHGDSAGVLIMGTTHEVRVFDDREVNLCRTIANELVLGITNASLYEKVTTSLAEKEVLLKEIHHRVKNNMSVIISLLNLQKNVAKAGDKVGDALEASANRIFSMSAVHEQIYRSDDFTHISGQAYVASMVHKFSAINSNPFHVDVQTEIDPIALNVNQAIPFGLILNELVTNALQHAFRGCHEGRILISMKKTDSNEVEFFVEDNGIGFPDEFSLKDAGSLGLHVVSILSEQLQGEVVLSPKSPTRILLRFPLEQ